MSSTNTGTNNPSFKEQNIYNVEGGSGGYPLQDGSNTQYMSAGIVNALNQVTTNNRIARQAANRLFVAVGTGTTEATAEDYTLGLENTDVICETITQTYTASYKRQITATFSNPTPQDVTLKEVGLFYESYMSEAYYINTIMLARENIDVTIPAGETKAITIEIG